MSESEKPPVTVLVVDDEATICRIVCRTLERNGFSTASISRAEELAKVLQDSHFDVILLDRSMGTESGGSLVPLIREKAPTAKILYFTGEHVDHAELSLVDGFVLKPVSGQDLARTIRSLF